MPELDNTATAVFAAWLSRFAPIVEAGDAEAVAALFLPYGWFRDVLALTWNTRALRGPPKIAEFLSSNLHPGAITDLTLDDNPHLTPFIRSDGSGEKVLEGSFLFETPIGHGKGHVHLVQQSNSTWRTLLVCTNLAELKGHEEPRGPPDWEKEAAGRSWGEMRAERQKGIESDPFVLIIGAGQTGLQVAARFNRMNIPALMIERNARVGDNWRKRYDSLALHTTKPQHQMLYQPYPSNWPIYTPRDKLADWLESYSVTQELPLWLKTDLAAQPVWDHRDQRWSVTVNRDGSLVKLRPAHIVVAIGSIGAPRLPELADQHLFMGQILHAVEFKNAKPYQNKDVVVVGAGNSSIDICQDLAVGGAKSVTMVQRSSTCVVARSNVAIGLGMYWKDDVPTEIGDFRLGSTPIGMIKEYMIAHQEETWAADKELHDKLRKGGLHLNIGPEGQGQLVLVWERGGGYWLDKGGADLIESGRIKIKQGSAVKSYTATGLTFEDGTELNADAVIFATGYRNMRKSSREWLGSDVIDRTNHILGLDEEGELNGGYRPCGHPGLWFATGDFYNSRYMSKQLALQIKAHQLGLNQSNLRASL